MSLYSEDWYLKIEVNERQRAALIDAIIVLNKSGDQHKDIVEQLAAIEQDWRWVRDNEPGE